MCIRDRGNMGLRFNVSQQNTRTQKTALFDLITFEFLTEIYKRCNGSSPTWVYCEKIIARSSKKRVDVAFPTDGYDCFWH